MVTILPWLSNITEAHSRLKSAETSAPSVIGPVTL